MLESALSSFPLVLHYKKVLGILFLTIGSINTLLGIWLVLLGDFNVSLLLGPMLLLIGFGYLTKPYLSVSTQEVALYNLLGMQVKSYPLRAVSDLEIENRKLYINNGGSRQKIKLATSLIAQSDWEQLEAVLGQLSASSR